MNKFAKIAWLAGLVASIASAPFAANAGSDPYAPPSVKVFHGDLDLASDGGEATLQRRIAAAVRKVCRGPSIAVHSNAQCRRKTAETVAAKVDAAVFAASQRRNLELAAR